MVEVDLVPREMDGHAQQHVHAAVLAFHGVACTTSLLLMQLPASHPDARCAVSKVCTDCHSVSVPVRRLTAY